MVTAEKLLGLTAQLTADVKLYSSDEGGRSSAILPGWGCPCMVSRKQPLIGWDAWPLLGTRPFEPGDARKLGFVFLSHEGLEVMRAAGNFLLWEGGFIGEAVVIEDAL